MTHWRSPHTDSPFRRRMAAYAAGALVGPLVAVLFVLVVIWLARAASAEDAPHTTSGSVAISTIDASSCWIASISNMDKVVTVDWACVHTFAERYREGKAEGYNDALAYVMQAIHDGEAKSK